MGLEHILKLVILENTILNWIIALAAAGLAVVGIRLIRYALARWLHDRYDKTSHLFDDFLYRITQRTWGFLRVAAAILTLLAILENKPSFTPTARGIAWLSALIQTAVWGSSIIDLYARHRVRIEIDENPSIATAMNAAGIIGKVVLWSLLLLLGLDNIPGIEVNTLIASLGISSIAVALAVQNILGDLFAALAIAFDKPFEIGDFINAGDYSGSVERIGIKSTRMRTPTGEQLVVSNSDLLRSRIRNFKRMTRRQQVFTVGVAADTPYEKLKQIPDILREIVVAQPKVEFGRAHFRTFGEYTLDFEVVYFLPVPDFTLFLDTQQAINLEIHRRFEEEGIGMPYPTQTVIVKRDA
jgi:small-conductance mechanosensitive channel